MLVLWWTTLAACGAVALSLSPVCRAGLGRSTPSCRCKRRSALPAVVSAYRDHDAAAAEWVQRAVPRTRDPRQGEGRRERAELAATHAMFGAVAERLRRETDAFGSRAAAGPFVLTPQQQQQQQQQPLVTFGGGDLRRALRRDFLGAGNGFLNQMAPVAGMGLLAGDRDTTAIGSAFAAARVTPCDLESAEGTVVFNSAGAHVSSHLAAVSLAALHGLGGLCPGVCTNLYLTNAGTAVSAPPHTDRQDVVVIQTQGRKRWRVFSPPADLGGAGADPFGLGKGGHDLPVEVLLRGAGGGAGGCGSELLLEVTLVPGDVLFVPARFPHTTDTLECYDDEEYREGEGDQQEQDSSSIHLTVGLDTHVWSMNFVSMRRLGLRKFGKADILSGHDLLDDDGDDGSLCTGAINLLSLELREHLFSSVGGCLLSTGNDGGLGPPLELERRHSVRRVAADLELLIAKVDGDAAAWLSFDQCVEVVEQFRDVGQKIFDTHAAMYGAAMEEERMRRREPEWNADETMTKDQSDRLSIFRVPMFLEQLDGFREELRAWSVEGSGRRAQVPIIHSLLDGDQVEVNLEGGLSWIPAKIVNVRADGLFDVQLFNGEESNGIRRAAIKGPHGIGIFI